jgi:GNAT superfamily N-acetyltransferase
VIKDDYRNSGYGSTLPTNAEAVAADRGCQYSTLETHDSQGMEFYIKNGYVVAGQLPDHSKWSCEIHFT